MLVGLHGVAKAGKDTSFGYIQEFAESRGRSAHRSAFGDKLKISAVRSLGFVGTDAECLAEANRMKQPGWTIAVREPDGSEHVITSREYWQYFGDEGHRQTFHYDFWVQFVMDEYAATAADYFVVTDVRYDNEALAITRAGGEIWHIDRPLPRMAHRSEQALPAHLIDLTITNATTRKQLRKQIRTVLKTREQSLETQS